ncbi:MAG TPA: septal ring lytic transglycosylase RlpA family protein [Polyangiaceae bacterium]|nr:septal ring lytic transglycosylase RlpA family protein [Polyangiaceae bacterium]
MRRSLWLVAATWWLLQLGACGDQPRPKSSHDARSSSSSGAAKRLPRGTEKRRHSGAEPAENMGESSHGAGAPLTSPDAPVSEEKLVSRYATARALTVLHGSASYYSDALAGRSTASGAPYEPSAFTAAHRSLPFGTVLRVTRVDGGQSVLVRVTDRGPYGPRGRILDLSRAAADRLGMLRAGVAKVKVEVLEYGPRKARRRRR